MCERGIDGLSSIFKHFSRSLEIPSGPEALALLVSNVNKKCKTSSSVQISSEGSIEGSTAKSPMLVSVMP